MVAKITMPKRLLAALHYNENKVGKGKAICLHAEGFINDAKDLSLSQKIEGIERLNERNERATTKTMHISLNFDPSEKVSEQKLKEIAATYIKGIGFESQPYLVYRHHDAAHPHIHIVTTAIREDGSRINTHNIGRNQSEKARKEIEEKFELVKAQGPKKDEEQKLDATHLHIVYGKSQTKESIGSVVQHVLDNYLFASIPELNAVLRLYGVQVETGGKESRLQKQHGLLFRMLDQNKNPVGVPIKASLLPSKPTLTKLEKLFATNLPLKEKHKPELRLQIEHCISERPRDLDQLRTLLAKKNINLIFRESTDGRIYGITFVDRNNKMVVNGSELGKRFSAAHLQTKLSKAGANNNRSQKTDKLTLDNYYIGNENLLGVLITPEQEFNPQPGQLLKKKKKKSKRNHLGL